MSNVIGSNLVFGRLAGRVQVCKGSRAKGCVGCGGREGHGQKRKGARAWVCISCERVYVGGCARTLACLMCVVCQKELGCLKTVEGKATRNGRRRRNNSHLAVRVGDGEEISVRGRVRQLAEQQERTIRDRSVEEHQQSGVIFPQGIARVLPSVMRLEPYRCQFRTNLGAAGKIVNHMRQKLKQAARNGVDIHQDTKPQRRVLETSIVSQCHLVTSSSPVIQVPLGNSSLITYPDPLGVGNLMHNGGSFERTLPGSCLSISYQVQYIRFINRALQLG